MGIEFGVSKVGNLQRPAIERGPTHQRRLAADRDRPQLLE